MPKVNELLVAEPFDRTKPPVLLVALNTKAPADCGPSSVTAMELLPVPANVSVPLLGTACGVQLPLLAQLVEPPLRFQVPPLGTTLEATTRSM